MGDHAHTSVELSHSPTPPSLEICANLARNIVGFHVDSFPQPLSLHSVDPLNCIVLCSSILDSSRAMNEDQDVDGIGVM